MQVRRAGGFIVSIQELEIDLVAVDRGWERR